MRVFKMLSYFSTKAYVVAHAKGVWLRCKTGIVKTLLFLALHCSPEFWYFPHSIKWDNFVNLYYGVMDLLIVNKPELQIRCVKWTSIDSTRVISSPNPMFDYSLESSRWDNSNKWSNVGFGEEISILENKKWSSSEALVFVEGVNCVFT